MNRRTALALLTSLGKTADKYSLESESALVESLGNDVVSLESAVASAARHGELSHEQKLFYEKKILLLKELIMKKQVLKSDDTFNENELNFSNENK